MSLSYIDLDEMPDAREVERLRDRIARALALVEGLRYGHRRACTVHAGEPCNCGHAARCDELARTLGPAPPATVTIDAPESCPSCGASQPFTFRVRMTAEGPVIKCERCEAVHPARGGKGGGR